MQVCFSHMINCGRRASKNISNYHNNLCSVVRLSVYFYAPKNHRDGGLCIIYTISSVITQGRLNSFFFPRILNHICNSYRKRVHRLAVLVLSPSLSDICTVTELYGSLTASTVQNKNYMA